MKNLIWQYYNPRTLENGTPFLSGNAVRVYSATVNYDAPLLLQTALKPFPAIFYLDNLHHLTTDRRFQSVPFELLNTVLREGIGTAQTRYKHKSYETFVILWSGSGRKNKTFRGSILSEGEILRTSCTIDFPWRLMKETDAVVRRLFRHPHLCDYTKALQFFKTWGKNPYGWGRRAAVITNINKRWSTM